MSELTSIPNPIPVVKPAVPEKVFDKQFCTQLTIDADPLKPWSARFTGVAYDGTALERSSIQVIELKDLKALAVKDPELAQAMGLVLAVIGKYLVKCKIKNKKIVTVANVEEILE